MDERELLDRTKRFSIRIMKLVAALPANRVADVIGRQLLRSGTSVGANYRAACRGRSTAEFLSKLGIVEEEADETCYWIELLIEEKIMPEPRLRPLLKEANELVAIVVSSRKTARRSNLRLNRKSQIANRKSK